jgi:hypothetical protein
MKSLHERSTVSETVHHHIRGHNNSEYKNAPDSPKSDEYLKSEWKAWHQTRPYYLSPGNFSIEIGREAATLLKFDSNELELGVSVNCFSAFGNYSPVYTN